MNDIDSSRKIQHLREDVYRRIAAGEVIDRPLSVVRELLDNSLDAGANGINIDIRDGGIGAIRVQDDGAGMAPSDLRLSIDAHTTSKIAELSDLDRVRSLGFRGEALASIGAVSKLAISSMTRERGASAHKIVVHNGAVISFAETAMAPGTTVSVEDLFYSMPARRKFLSRPSTESSRCLQTCIEKSLAFPAVSFKIVADSRPQIVLPTCGSRLERATAALYPQLKGTPLYAGESERDGVLVKSVTTDPSFHRGDRRLVQIFVNSRRVNDYSLIQAACYAYDPFLPGGRYPAIMVFIEIDPARIDFNVHPAKSEVRFRGDDEIRPAVIEAISKAASQFGTRISSTSLSPLEGRHVPGGVREEGKYQPTLPSLLDLNSSAEVPRSSNHGATSSKGSIPNFRYIGQLFSLFLLVELDETLFLIDQHAAHERILFDLLRSTNHNRSQNLLVPRRISPALSNEMRELAEKLRSIGITIESESDRWYLRSLPSGYGNLENTVVDFVENFRGGHENLDRSLFAMAACRTAVKSSDLLDDETAIQLTEQALSLKEPRCPHGRPVWVEITKESLLEMVGRT